MELEQRLEKNCGKLIFDCTDEEIYEGLLRTVMELKDNIPQHNDKRKLYYVSAEFLIGKLLESNLISLGVYNKIREILEKNGKSISQITELESEASLGNGGLGRLAACFLDSIAHLDLSGDGVGLLYHFGLFRQKFENNKQAQYKNDWIESSRALNKTDILYEVEFRNQTVKSRLYTIDIYGKNRINKLNLFDLETVDENIVGEGLKYDKNDIEKNLTLFLYPDDSDESGRRLRLYQEYFMVSSCAQLIIEESIRRGSNLYDIADYAVVQINDTHPSLIIPELIRLLKKRGIELSYAIESVSRMCAYTNHTILSEALEKWDSRILEAVIPDVMDIIRELDKRIKERHKDRSLHIIDSDGVVHMARLDIHYGFSINGVASLHTQILKESELNNFYKIYPQKFNNKTNGISMRRWLGSANPLLYDYIVSLIGDSFTDDYTKLSELLKFKNDKNVLNKLIEIKNLNKSKFSEFLLKHHNTCLDNNSVFDVQIKRLHEYKRQQMNILYFINKYLDIKRGIIPKRPITAIFGAKAAGAYTIAKDIIHLILCMQELLDKDKEISKYLKIFMADNYNVTWAEKIIPASDISEQISLASKEASGTGNMKLMLNGAVTIGTLDGANVEISRLVGNENIYIFGDESEEVIKRYEKGSYRPCEYYEQDKRIKEAVDFITGKELLKIGDGESLKRLKNELINKDYFMTFPDFSDYTKTKEKAFSDFEKREEWAGKMLFNIAMSGYFSSDRTISEYNKDIWKLK